MSAVPDAPARWSSPTGRRPHGCLPGDDADLLRRVAALVEAVAGSTGRWPTKELRCLLECLRDEVLDRVGWEESVIFPASPSPVIAQLTRDHARLRVGVEALERAAVGEGSQSVEQLGACARGLLFQLRRHFEAEQRSIVGRAPVFDAS